MCEFYIQQRTLSDGKRSIVLDENARPVYFLTGSMLSNGDTLSLYDMSGRKLVEIKQVGQLLGRHYDIFVNNEKIATLKKKWTFTFQDIYFVEQLNWTIQGNLHAHHYQIMKGIFQVLKMYPASTSVGDVYCLEISEKENAPVAIVLAFVLDYWVFSGKRLEMKSFSGEVKLV
ncbi:Uncharacterized protein YxjI [Pilibacter termitis]|uniref:Uncharacterized protein YxjI n=1 Tax=Pilibacter termitis TaxID=263852 RepID=A0A1T4LAL1_9ENTE|nr:LURP-one-related family protein [Pilibacter termitis]SJZ51631.1 Uncharacterized protein YxjI [Pilibacter termitis]